MPTRSGPPRPPQRAQPNQQAQQSIETTGPLNAVPCPWCRQKMDFRAFAGQQAGGLGEGDIGLETGALFSCDNQACKRPFTIQAIQQITVLKLRRARTAPKK